MSRLPFELLLALRYLRPKRTFVSIITLISVLGVTLGVAVLSIVISVMSGFDHQLREKVLGFSAHLQIHQVNIETGRWTTLAHYGQVSAIIKTNAEVKSCSPFVQEQVVLKTEREKGAAGIAAPFIRGIDPEAETNNSVLTTNLIGSADLSGYGLLVGRALASTLGLRLGDRVAVLSPHDLDDMMKSQEKKEELVVPPTDYEVRGIFDSGFNDYNEYVVVSSLQNAQDLYRMEDNVDGLMVMLQDPYRADAVKDKLMAALGTKYDITTWAGENPTMQAVMVEKDVMLYILFFIVIVAAFGISCTLITFVVLKTRDIGVLKALGATDRQVMWIFLSQSMLISVLGVFGGLLFGRLAIAYRNEFLHLMRRFTGMELFPAKIYGFTELPALIIPGDIAIICGGSLLICLAAAVFPAWNASRLKPVEALRRD